MFFYISFSFQVFMVHDLVNAADMKNKAHENLFRNYPLQLFELSDNVWESSCWVFYTFVGLEGRIFSRLQKVIYIVPFESISYRKVLTVCWKFPNLLFNPTHIQTVWKTYFYPFTSKPNQGELKKTSYLVPTVC